MIRELYLRWRIDNTGLQSVCNLYELITVQDIFNFIKKLFDNGVVEAKVSRLTPEDPYYILENEKIVPVIEATSNLKGFKRFEVASYDILFWDDDGIYYKAESNVNADLLISNDEILTAEGFITSIEIEKKLRED